MTTNAASEGKLGSLHDRVATLLDLALSNYQRRQEFYAEHMDKLQSMLTEVQEDEDNPFKGMRLSDFTMTEVPAALINSAITFLKNNEITCAPESSGTMSALQERLNNKRRKQLSDIDATGT